MLPCFFYTKNSNLHHNKDFKCLFELQNIELIKTENCKTMNYFHCPNYKFCELQYAKQVGVCTNGNVAFLANTIVNKHINGKIEICKYEKSFPIVKFIDNNIVKSRNWFIDDDGLLCPLTKDANFGKYKDSIMRGSNRALDDVKSILENNDWDYFITLTFSDKFVNDKFDDTEIKYEWKKFRQSLSAYDNNVKILCIPERHESGALHFHCVVGISKDFPVILCKEGNTWNSDGSPNKPINGVSKYLFPIYEDKWKKFVNGDQAFALSFFNKGRNYTAILPKNGSHDAVKNYIGKYINKSIYTGYGKQRFLCTHNLTRKEKYCIYCDDDDLNNYINEYKLKVFKKDEDLEVYRNFNIMEEKENGNKES